MDDPVAPLAESARFFLAALRAIFEPLIVRVEDLGLRTWSDGKASGTRLELFFRVDGAGAGDRADAFCEQPLAPFDIPDFAVREIGVCSAVRGCGRGAWARIALEAIVCPAARELTVVPDEEQLHPSGLVVPRRGRDGQPWFLLGYLSGNVVITNGQPEDWAVRLYRLYDERQARAAGEVLAHEAQLDLDGQSWFVPEAREANDRDAQLRALVRWIERIDPSLAMALRGLGPHHYSLTNKIRERL